MPSTLSNLRKNTSIEGALSNGLELKTDEHQVIDGLDRTVLRRKKGEATLLTTTPGYAFGLESQQELARVLPNSPVYNEGELVSLERDMESWDINTQESIEGLGPRFAVADRLFTMCVLSLLLAGVLGAPGKHE